VSKCSTNVCKICRRENQKLFFKADRCYTDKCSFERRPYPPGQHGQSRLKFSEYALQLREKQKVRRYYGIHEKQFRRYFKDADRNKGETGFNLLQRLEIRLDNVIYLLGLAASRKEARHLITHKHYTVNGQRVNKPELAVEVGDVVQVREKSRQITKIMAAMESSQKREMPAWLSADHASFKGEIKDLPKREEIPVSVEENMIVEYYSR